VIRGSLTVALAATVAVALASTAIAAAPLRLVRVPNVNFPDRAFALTTAKAEHIDPGAVQVTENGLAVLDQRIVPAGAAAKGTFGVVLVIDASASMSGAPITNAMDAARAFAGRRTANEQLGLLLFNNRVVTTLPPTTDQGAITRSLAPAPTVAVGTHIYDALGAQMLASRRSCCFPMEPTRAARSACETSLRRLKPITFGSSRSASAPISSAGPRFKLSPRALTAFTPMPPHRLPWRRSTSRCPRG